MRTANVPFLALPISLQHERALARAGQYPYFAHPFLLSSLITNRRGWNRHPAAKFSLMTFSRVTLITNRRRPRKQRRGIPLLPPPPGLLQHVFAILLQIRDQTTWRRSFLMPR